MRGWVRKNRGNAIQKLFKDRSIIEKEMHKLFENKKAPPILYSENKNIEVEINEKLEDEILYFLRTFPKGVSSPKVIKSILVENANASLSQIEHILNNSDKIAVVDGRWIVKEASKIETKGLKP